MTDTCFPLGQGVPTTIPPDTWPTWSGPPFFVDKTGGNMPFFNDRLDDPRWVGARRITSPGSGGGAGEHVSFRALHATAPAGVAPAGVTLGDCLFLSWNVRVDVQLQQNDDLVVVGFHRPGAAKAWVAKIRPFSSGTPGAGSPIIAEKFYAPAWFEGTKTGATWSWATGTAPAWLAPATGYTRVWADSVTNRWAVEMLVPTTAAGGGIDLPIPFELFYSVQVTLGADPANPAQNLVNYHDWPTLLNEPTNSDLFPEPDSANWGDVQYGGPEDPACTAGISLLINDIGTGPIPAPANLGHEIKFKKPPPANPVQPVNTFHARPWNRSGAQVPVNGILTRFRLANWGSLPDWDDPTLKDQLWTDLATGGSVPNATAIDDAKQGDITTTWQLNATELEQYAPSGGGTPAKRSHQCMLVELSPGPAAGSLNFVNDSVYCNMEVVPASTFEREAEISVKTLEPIGGTQRDVYVYVETLNMPANTTPAEEARRKAEAARKREERLAAIADERPPESIPESPPIIGLGRGDEKDEGRTEPWLVPTPEDIEAEWPMYRVHVWADTGETVTQEDGKVCKVLRAQTSFGYQVDHAGDLYGWDHALAGAGLQELRPHFYRLRVPNGGTATVKTHIRAYEKPRPKHRGGCLGLILAALAFLRGLVKH